MIGLGLAFLAILVVLLLVLAELRMLSRTWTGFLDATSKRSEPLLEHANSAARNLDHVTTVVRSEIDRLHGNGRGCDGTTSAKASVEVRRRIADLSALLDLAQSEAEDAVSGRGRQVADVAEGGRVAGEGGGAGWGWGWCRSGGRGR